MIIIIRLFRFLTGTYTAFSGILLLNLFIALMSDTFQRVYDNAKANALMQKAIAITTYQASLSYVSKERFLIYLHGQCAPQVRNSSQLAGVLVETIVSFRE